ncbi:autoinducer 2 ABC transporter substrate-binding protein [Amycolatopsis magusensis]|uniref:Rhamnose transport system substrate-binding protein n=2 Tax=Actinomycetes TaxID=1760 RepID=A0ABS4PRB3_9PSEU|nr:autoinducer 2 ABC transporter substrate-binding protein [Amycolatopsis magusensis]MBP2181430.1 rhamnose transport system substrate-binding protein [Amycolatopsis magusensis]MDI5974999.1 autoinducer 2 ABC transporter substrate-binding protein [Amycolatopsis magusensis]
MRLPRRLAVIAAVACLVLSGCGAEPPAEPPAESIEIAFVPKVQSIAYFDAMNGGGLRAADVLGVRWTYRGPLTADAAEQAAIVREFVARGVNVIVVAPNDPESIAPVVAEAKAKGIRVLTTDTDAPNSGRELFVNQASAESIGRALTDELMRKTGGTGQYAIVSCGPTAANLNAWIAVQKAYTAQNYAGAQIVDIVHVGEDQNAAAAKAKELMAAHPQLTGLVGECTTSAPGVAKAVREAGRIGQVFTVGVGTPQSMKEYLRDGSASASVLWDVENLGYLTAWAAKQAADGKVPEPLNNVSPELPAVRYNGADKTLVLGDPLLITNDNVDQFDY